MGPSLFTFVLYAPNTHLFCIRLRFGRSRSSKVDDFGTNRKRVYDFLLVGHWDYGPVLHRFRDTVTYWLKIAYFATFLLPLSHSAPSLPRFTLEFRAEINREETRIMGLSSSEDRMILAGVVLAWYRTVTDGWTDGRTVGRSDRIYHS